MMTQLAAPAVEAGFHWTDWITAVGTGFAALAAIIATITGLVTARTWKVTLENQRADECIAAATELEASVSRCIDATRKRRLEDLWLTYTECWNNLTKFSSTILVARRYRQGLDASAPDHVIKLLQQLSTVAKKRGNNQDEKAPEGISTKMSAIAAAVVENAEMKSWRSRSCSCRRRYRRMIFALDLSGARADHADTNPLPVRSVAESSVIAEMHSTVRLRFLISNARSSRRPARMT
jgi:hypothetical protein